MGLDFYQRLMTGREIGERLGLTNSERDRLKLWQFKPIDMTDEQLVEHRRRKKNERRRSRRGRTRAEYLAGCLTATKPWEAEGICRRTWERRRVATHGPNNSVCSESTLATAGVDEKPKGAASEAVAPEGRATTKKSGANESHAPCSSALRPRLASDDSELSGSQKLRAALKR
jgi:hypothetical protein